MKVSSSIKTSAAATFFQDLVVIFSNHAEIGEDEYLVPKMKFLSERADYLVKLLKTPRSSFGLTTSDKAREAAYDDVIQGLKGYLIYPFPEKKEAAAFFMEIFTRHGGRKILSQKYIDTSALIDSLEKDCSTTEAKEKLAKLDGMDAVFAAFFQANKDFKAKFVDKESVAKAKTSADSATSVKKELLAYCNTQILPYIDAMRLSFPAKFKDFADAVEGAVKTVNASSPRKAKAEKSAETAEEAKTAEGKSE